MERSTQDGILRAFALLLGQQSGRKVKQKYTYSSYGNAIHARRSLTKVEADAVDGIAGKLRKLNPNDTNNDDQIKALLSDLNKLPVTFVPMKREYRIDRSKTYPYGSKRQGY